MNTYQKIFKVLKDHFLDTTGDITNEHIEKCAIDISNSIFPKKTPLQHTIIADRYNGMYSGGKYTAWNMAFTEIPKDVDGNDIECKKLWDAYRGIEPKEYRMTIGFGDTPLSALDDLIEKTNK